MNAKSPCRQLMPRESGTLRGVRHAASAFSFLIAGLALSACGARTAGTGADAQHNATSPAKLKCGSTTYNLGVEKIDAETNEACDRLNKSFKLHQSTRERTRFICHDPKGHIVMSVLVPDALLPNYDKSCQEFSAADQPFENGSADRQSHFDALKKLQSETNQLTRQTVDEANAMWRQNRADQAALNKLIKERGGSIEITD
jgi:hypothetical protein